MENFYRNIWYCFVMTCFMNTSVYGQTSITTPSGQKLSFYSSKNYSVNNIDSIMQVSENMPSDVTQILSAALSKEAALVIEKMSAENKIIRLELEMKMLSKNDKTRKKLYIKQIKDNQKISKVTTQEIKKINKHIAQLKAYNIEKPLKHKKLIQLSEYYGLKISETNLQKPLRQKEVAHSKSKKVNNKKSNQPNCDLVIDSFINKKEWKLSNELFLFHHTPEKLASHFKTNALFETYVQIEKINKEYLLHLNIKMASIDSGKSYGFIPKNNFLRINFISGHYLILHVRNDVKGSIEPYTGRLLYTASFAIPREELRLLYLNPINEIGLQWSTGYEIYPIFHVDAVMDAMHCIHQN